MVCFVNVRGNFAKVVLPLLYPDMAISGNWCRWSRWLFCFHDLCEWLQYERMQVTLAFECPPNCFVMATSEKLSTEHCCSNLSFRLLVICLCWSFDGKSKKKKLWTLEWGSWQTLCCDALMLWCSEKNITGACYLPCIICPPVKWWMQRVSWKNRGSLCSGIAIINLRACRSLPRQELARKTQWFPGEIHFIPAIFPADIFFLDLLTSHVWTLINLPFVYKQIDRLQNVHVDCPGVAIVEYCIPQVKQTGKLKKYWSLWSQCICPHSLVIEAGKAKSTLNLHPPYFWRPSLGWIFWQNVVANATRCTHRENIKIHSQSNYLGDTFKLIVDSACGNHLNAHIYVRMGGRTSFSQVN